MAIVEYEEFTLVNKLGLSEQEMFEKAKVKARELTGISDVSFLGAGGDEWRFTAKYPPETHKTETKCGVKHNKGKPEFSHTPVEFEIGVAKAFTYGAQKYDADNFRNGISTRELLDAMDRHMRLEKSGVEKDEESGLPHWAHAAASLAMYVFMIKQRPSFDNRFKYTEEEKKRIMEDIYG